jgi:hypothetical protein
MIAEIGRKRAQKTDSIQGRWGIILSGDAEKEEIPFRCQNSGIAGMATGRARVSHGLSGWKNRSAYISGSAPGFTHG